MVRNLFVFLSVFSLACSPKDTDPEAALERPDWALDFLHEVDGIDSTNLWLNEDGSFVWTINGCDFSGGGLGRWSVVSDSEITLLPPEGEDAFLWLDDISFMNEVESVTLTPADTGFVADASDNSTTRWATGASCADCGGDMGPTGQDECEQPFGYPAATDD